MRKAGGILIIMLLSFILEYEVCFSSDQRNAYAPSIASAVSASGDIKSTPEELYRRAYDTAIASTKQSEAKIDTIKNISLFQLALIFILAIIFINTGNEISEIKSKLFIK